MSGLDSEFQPAGQLQGEDLVALLQSDSTSPTGLDNRLATLQALRAFFGGDGSLLWGQIGGELADQADIAAALSTLGHAISQRVRTLRAGPNIEIDDTDPENPIISAAGGGGEGGGGVVGFVGSIVSAAPNAGRHVALLQASSSTTGVDVALAPKGPASLGAHVADGTAAGGHKRGTYAVDWQHTRDYAQYVASGTSSTIGGGYNNEAHGGSSTVAGGQNNSANGAGATVVGGNANTVNGARGVGGGNGVTVGGANGVAFGEGCQANGTSSVASGGTYCYANGNHAAIGGGRENKADGECSWIPGGMRGTTRGVKAAGAYGPMFFDQSPGKCQVQRYVLGMQTYENAATLITTNAQDSAEQSNQVYIPNGGAYVVRAVAVARGNDMVKAWDVRVVAKNVNGTITVLGTPTLEVLHADVGTENWGLTTAADSANQSLQFKGKAEANGNFYVRWCVDVYACAQVVRYGQ